MTSRVTEVSGRLSYAEYEECVLETDEDGDRYILHLHDLVPPDAFEGLRFDRDSVGQRGKFKITVEFDASLSCSGCDLENREIAEDCPQHGKDR